MPDSHATSTVLVSGAAHTERVGMKRTEAGINAQKVSYAARQRAYRRLAKLHPEEFQAIWDAERKADGWEPRPLGRPKVNA